MKNASFFVVVARCTYLMGGFFRKQFRDINKARLSITIKFLLALHSSRLFDRSFNYAKFIRVSEFGVFPQPTAEKFDALTSSR
jgi:hypothetical protein